MRTLQTTLVALGVWLTAGPASAATANYVATLSPDQEPVAVNLGTHHPTGVGNFSYDDSTKQLCGTITYSDLTGSATSVQVHQAPANDPGGVGAIIYVAPKFQTPVAVALTLNTVQATALVEEGLYVQIHTVQNGNGELRGSLTAGGPGGTCPEVPDAGPPPPPPPSPSDAGTPDSGASSSSGSGDSGCVASSRSRTDASSALVVALAVAMLGFRRRRR